MPRPRSRHFSLLGVVIVLALAVESYGGVLNAKGLNNSIAYNLFNILESLLFLLIVHAIQPRLKVLLIVAAGMIAAAYFLDLSKGRSSPTLLHDAIVFAAMLQAIFCMAVLWHLAQSTQAPLVRVPEFWLFLGLLIYFAGIVPVIGFQRFIYLRDWPTASRLYKIVPALCITRYLLAAYACNIAGRRSGMPGVDR